MPKLYRFEESSPDLITDFSLLHRRQLGTSVKLSEVSLVVKVQRVTILIKSWAAACYEVCWR
jgi:hypothetical protein